MKEETKIIIEYDDIAYGEPFTEDRTKKYAELDLDGDWVTFPKLGRIRLRSKPKTILKLYTAIIVPRGKMRTFHGTIKAYNKEEAYKLIKKHLWDTMKIRTQLVKLDIMTENIVLHRFIGE